MLAHRDTVEISSALSCKSGDYMLRSDWRAYITSAGDLGIELELFREEALDIHAPSVDY